MLFLLGGVAILCGLLLLAYLFVNTAPAVLARILKWLGIGLAVLAALAIVVSGRLAMLLGAAAALMPVLRRLRMAVAGFGGPAGQQFSEVETLYLRLRLDHDTGELSGTVLQGRFSGCRIEELELAQLLDLLRECRAVDDEGARLLEAYLDRAHPHWRDDLRRSRAEDRNAPPAATDVSVDEAYAILGLAADADEAAIRAAHHRLMKQLHPDHGGTDYLATKVNRARDVLLKQR